MCDEQQEGLWASLTSDTSAVPHVPAVRVAAFAPALLVVRQRLEKRFDTVWVDHARERFISVGKTEGVARRVELVARVLEEGRFARPRRDEDELGVLGQNRLLC